MKYLKALWVAVQFLLLLFGAFFLSDLAMSYLPHWLGVLITIAVVSIMGVLMFKLSQSAPQTF